MIDSAPKIVDLVVDADENLIQMPAPLWPGLQIPCPLATALSRCWRLLQSHSEICDLRQQRSTPSIAETPGLEILSWCGGM